MFEPLRRNDYGDTWFDQVGFIPVSLLLSIRNPAKLCSVLAEEFASPGTKWIIRVNQLEMHCAYARNAQQAVQRWVQLVVLDKMLHFICRHLLVFPLFLETLLAFVIMLHFAFATVLLWREIAGLMLAFFWSTTPMFLQLLGVIKAKDLLNLLQPGWVTQGWGIYTQCSLSLLPCQEPPACAFEQSLKGCAPLTTWASRPPFSAGKAWIHRACLFTFSASFLPVAPETSPEMLDPSYKCTTLRAVRWAGAWGNTRNFS